MTICQIISYKHILVKPQKNSQQGEIEGFKMSTMSVSELRATLAEQKESRTIESGAFVIWQQTGLETDLD